MFNKKALIGIGVTAQVCLKLDAPLCVKKTDMPSSAKVKRLQSESLHSCHFFLFPTSKRIAIGLRTILMQAVLSVVSISFESRVMPTQMCNLRDYFMFGPEHSGVIRLMKPSKRQGEI